MPRSRAGAPRAPPPAAPPRGCALGRAAASPRVPRLRETTAELPGRAGGRGATPPPLAGPALTAPPSPPPLTVPARGGTPAQDAVDEVGGEEVQGRRGGGGRALHGCGQGPRAAPRFMGAGSARLRAPALAFH